MGNLKFSFYCLVILFKISDVVSLLGFSKVSKVFNNIQPSEYLVPKIYHPHTESNINSTLGENGTHLNNIEIMLSLKDDKIILKLQLNHNIISKNFKQIYHENGHERIIKPNLGEMDYCHYTGKIKEKEESWAVLSTCNGISGIIYDENKFYFIENSQLDDSRVHHVYISSPLSNLVNITKSRRKRNTVHNILGGPYDEDENSRYVELGLVFDNKLYKRLGSISEITSYATAISNLVNAYYSRINIYVVLIGVVIWTEKDEFVLETGTILNNFTNYVKTKLVNKFYFDSVHLISSINVIEDGVGVAGVATVCENICTGVSDDLKSILGTATTVAHELGHNLGLAHDTSDCSCPEPQCIMVGVRRSNTMSHFSSCSIDSLQKSYESGKHYCLKNKPEVISDDLSNCGNGILEPGEQCDCGLSEYCANHCCDALTCTFKNNSECATGSCCDLQTCKLKDAATPCRPAFNECDLPEYCTGDSYNCPEDTFKLDTEKCNDEKSFCHQGFCGSSSKCSAKKTNLNNKYLECYKVNSHFLNENNYCKTNSLTDAIFVCNSWSSFRICSQAKYETIKFDSKVVGIHTSIYGKEGSIVVCTLTIIDADPKAVQNASLCNTKQEHCLSMSNLRKRVPTCPVDCHNNGWCNNKGHCHCKDGYAPPDCSEPGFGGSLESGPSSNPYGFILVRNIMFIFFLGIVPLLALIAITSHLIIEEHGTWKNFFKKLFSSKKILPTISHAISEQENLSHRQSPYPNQDGITSYFSPTNIPEVQSIKNRNCANIKGYSNKIYDSNPKFFTFLKRISLRNSTLTHDKVDKPNQGTSSKEVEYVNIMETSNGINKTDMDSIFNKRRHSRNETVNYVNIMEINAAPNKKVSNSKVNKNKYQKEQQKIPKTAPSSINQTKHSKTETAASPYYDEFAKRKKRLQMNTTNLNRQKESRKLDSTKTELRPSQSRPSSSNSDDNKASVKEMIKRFNVNKS